MGLDQIVHRSEFYSRGQQDGPSAGGGGVVNQNLKLDYEALRVTLGVCLFKF